MEVRSAAEARLAAGIAADLGVALVLVSPRGGAASMGPAMFAAIVAAGREAWPAATGLLDCEAAEGHVLHALRVGAEAVIYKGPAEFRDKLSAIAAAGGRTVTAERPPALVLHRQKDPPAACRRWLAAAGTADHVA